MCVSNPGQRVFHHHSFHFTWAGGSRVCSWREPTKLQVQTRISKEDALSTYLQPELLTTLSHLLCLIPWFFTILPPNALVPSSCAAGLIAQLCSRVFRVRLETMFNHTVSADFSTLRFFAILPIREFELTEYKLSKCVPLSRPTRVLSVIPVTGAPILHGKATTPTHHRSLDSHRKAPTPSQNQPPHRPPGQKTVLEEYFRFQLSDLRFQHSDFFSCLPIMCVFLCLLCCCRDSFIDRTQGWALQLFSLIRDA